MLLIVAGILSCSLALYHLVLPYHMGWRRGLDGVPDSLVWALFALNFSWSVLVLLAGTLVIHAATLGPGASSGDGGMVELWRLEYRSTQERR